MEVALPPMIAIGGYKGLGTLDICQEDDFVGGSIDLIEFGMAPLVGIGVHEEPVVVYEMMVAIGIELGIGTALPFLHLWL